MAQLSIFTDSNLPEAHEHQIRSFIRLHWHDEYQYTSMVRWSCPSATPPIS